MMQPVHGTPALFDPGSRCLVVADLHLGIEHEMLQAGVRMPSGTSGMLDVLLDVIRQTGARTLVIAGDLKHSVPVPSFREERDIPRFLGALLEVLEEVHLVPGNHDGGIGGMLPDGVELHSARGMVMGDIGIWHGHTWPSEDVMGRKRVITAHVHPRMMLVDRVGGRKAERCWLRGPWDAGRVKERYGNVPEEYIMLPAFNGLCGGSHVNVRGQRHIGTMLRNRLADILRAEIFLLDGTHLGLVGDNMVGPV